MEYVRFPDRFYEIPAALQRINDRSDPEDVAQANSIRAEYHLDMAPNPYMVDICRAFRVAKGAEVYIEVGTQDKGNIAWLARTKLAPGCTIIDIDFNEYPDHDAKIAKELTEGGFDYHAIRGDCLSDEVLNKVRRILNGRKADLIFCDSHYTYEHTMTEFSLYYPLVREGGHLFFHDAQWTGDPNSQWEEMRKRGKGYAIADIDRFYPAYAVYSGERPVYRFTMPPLDVSYWGTVAIIPK